MLPDRRLYTRFVFWLAAVVFFIISMVQVALVFWRAIDGWFGPF